jgi:hypothetical protein
MGTGYDISASASLASSAANTAGIRTALNAGPVQFGAVNFGSNARSSWPIIAIVAGVVIVWLWLNKRK